MSEAGLEWLNTFQRLERTMARWAGIVCFLFVLNCTAQPPVDAAAQQAGQARDAAVKAQGSAEAAASAADAAKGEAIKAQTDAAQAKTDAVRAKDDAVMAKTGAVTAKGKAQDAQRGAESAATMAGGLAGQAKTSADDAQRQDMRATANADDAKQQDDSATTNAVEAEKYEGIAKRAARLSRKESARASRAVPVSEQLQPPNGGFKLTLTVNCTDLSKRECARLAKPVSVEVMRDGKPDTPEFSPGDLTGGSINVTLTSFPLDLKMKVRVIYGEGKLRTAWEPVVPSAAQTICCDFLSVPGAVYAFAPIDRMAIYLQAKDSAGQVRPFQLVGSKETTNTDFQNWWKFTVTQCPPPVASPQPPLNLHRCLAPGDTVTIFADVNGELKQLAQGSWPTAQAPTPPQQAATLPAQVPVIPVAFAPTPPPASGVVCEDPQIAAPLQATAAGLFSVTVTFGCLVKPPAFVLYVDNKPKSEPADLAWTPVNRFQYIATLKSPLRPYQWVKVVQLDPPEVDPDPPAVQVQNPSGLAPLPTEQPWWVTTPGVCAPPTIAPSLHPGDMSVTFTFPNSPAGPACHPDPSQVQIFVDNV
jgi:hypothetical protein